MKTPPHSQSQHLADPIQPAFVNSSPHLVSSESLLDLPCRLWTATTSSINPSVTLHPYIAVSGSVYSCRSLIQCCTYWLHPFTAHLVFESLVRKRDRARCCGGFGDSLRCSFGQRVSGHDVFIVIARYWRWIRLYISS